MINDSFRFPSRRASSSLYILWFPCKCFRLLSDSFDLVPILVCVPNRTSAVRGMILSLVRSWRRSSFLWDWEKCRISKDERRGNDRRSCVRTKETRDTYGTKRNEKPKEERHSFKHKSSLSSRQLQRSNLERQPSKSLDPCEFWSSLLHHDFKSTDQRAILKWLDCLPRGRKGYKDWRSGQGETIGARRKQGEKTAQQKEMNTTTYRDSTSVEISSQSFPYSGAVTFEHASLTEGATCFLVAFKAFWS